MKSKKFRIDGDRQEITQNISGFPITCEFSEFSDSTYQFIDWHWHVEFQVCLVTEGSVLWQIGEEKTVINKGEGIFINSQQVHMAKIAYGKKAAFFCIDIKPDFLCQDRESEIYKQYVQPFLERDDFAFQKIAVNCEENENPLKILAQMTDTVKNSEEGYELLLAGNTFLMWKYLNKYLVIKNRTEKGENKIRLKQMLSFIQKNYAEEITLEKIAENSHISRSECCRYFKKFTGQTVFEYIVSYRINKSLEMLKNSKKTIAEISAEVGFSNQSYYTKRFKEFTGKTPMEYRKGK